MRIVIFGIKDDSLTSEEIKNHSLKHFLMNVEIL